MKKIILQILLLVMFMPFVVNAKEYCTVVSGNGKDIGSEIACGTEHFYVIDNDGNNVKMLSKYNLYVGANYNKIKVDSNIYRYSKCNDSNCNSLTGNHLYYFEDEKVDYDDFMSMIESKYSIEKIRDYIDLKNNGTLYTTIPDYSSIMTISGETYIKENIKLYPYTIIDSDENEYALQNKLALGVTGDKGNANYPIYATLPVFPGNYGAYGNFYDLDTSSTSTKNYDNFEDGYTNFEFKNGSNILYYLDDYKNNLNSLGFEISNIDMINMKELYDLVKAISKKNLPLANWYNASLEKESIEDDNTYYHELGDLKQYLSNDYKWLWNTTYWTKTFMGNDDSNSAEEFSQLYFVSSSGEICYSLSECWSGIPRAGIRPVITISKDMIKYNIYTKTDGNGTIEVVDSSFGGKSISFRVSAKKGFRLAGLTVTADSGEKVQFSEEELTTNTDGITSISTNKFTMPYENVTIEAKWASNIINPNTGNRIYLILLVITLIVSTSLYIEYKK